LIGIRDDADNRFQFPREEYLTKRLKDVLEDDVDDKYFLSEKMIHYISHDRNGNYNLVVNREIANAMTCSMKNQQRSFQDNYIQIKSATSKGYEEAREGDSINFKNINSKTRRGRVGKGVAQTLESNNMSQGVIQKTTYGKHQQDCFYDCNGIIGAIPAGTHGSTPHLTKTLMPCGTKIRRLTPRECFRLMDFPDTFTWKVSDSQAYKQAGNSIVVNVLYKILKQLPL
jgi:DNA (cytosine-5)-methyltransferase 1